MILSEKIITADEISDLWISLWACNCKGLTEEEAYQTLNTILESKRATNLD
jgi:hypothetical protein